MLPAFAMFTIVDHSSIKISLTVVVQKMVTVVMRRRQFPTHMVGLTEGDCCSYCEAWVVSPRL